MKFTKTKFTPKHNFPELNLSVYQEILFIQGNRTVFECQEYTETTITNDHTKENRLIKVIMILENFEDESIPIMNDFLKEHFMYWLGRKVQI
jgi:hypothetical protein